MLHGRWSHCSLYQNLCYMALFSMSFQPEIALSRSSPCSSHSLAPHFLSLSFRIFPKPAAMPPPANPTIHIP